MRSKTKLWRKPVVLALILCVYPLFVLGYTWSHVFRSELEGGRHGPLDAYRHALASAVVSYTLDERAVDLVNNLLESKNRDSNKMDRHNNLIGAHVGARSKSFSELEPAIRLSITKGSVNATDTDQITWLPKDKWRNIKWW